MRVEGVSDRSCDGWCTLNNMEFEVTAVFQKQEGGALFTPVQRAVSCEASEKMVRVRVDGVLSAMRFCVNEDASNVTMPENTL